MDPIKTISFSDGRTLEIIPDEDPLNPRVDYDNLGTIAAFHGRYNLGDKDHGIDHTEFGGWDEMGAWIKHKNPDCVILLLYLYDHSGITMSTGPFSCPWDSAQVGFIFVSRERIVQEYGTLDPAEATKRAEACLRDEVALYDQYLTGDVFGFILRNPPCDKCGGPGEDSDSCWGFFGSDPLENGMVDNLDPKYREELEAAV